MVYNIMHQKNLTPKFFRNVFRRKLSFVNGKFSLENEKTRLTTNGPVLSNVVKSREK